MNYSINEVFVTVQGEGHHAGRKAVFVRFAGCNMWDGNPDHRAKGKGACAKWCDTDFLKGKKTDLNMLVQTMTLAWGQHGYVPFCVLSGGEPALQVDIHLLRELELWDIAIETNGTIQLPGFRKLWVTLSPKLMADGKLPKLANLHRIDELKIILPGSTVVGHGWSDDQLNEVFDWAEERGCQHFYVQPMDPVDPSKVDVTLLRRNYDRTNGKLRGLLNASWKFNIERCYGFVIANPEWRISAQTHKMLNLP